MDFPEESDMKTPRRFKISSGAFFSAFLDFPFLSLGKCVCGKNLLTSHRMKYYNSYLSEKRFSFKIRQFWNGEKQKAIQL
jgi:hypothetical protein